MRDNPDLDDVFLNHAAERPKPVKPRRRRQSGNRDKVRRYAFRVLALLAGLDATDRERVLKAAQRLNRA